MDLNTLYHRSVECWADRVNAVGPGQWDDPTPCRDWTVRDLVNHVVGEDRWTVPLVDGRTIADVGTTLDGDLLGDDPVGSALDAARLATTRVAEKLPDGGQVHLSYGDAPIGDYVHELAADHLLHSWDLAVATGGNARLDPQVTAELAEWFAGKEALYREFGVIGPRAISHGGVQSDLLAAAGRDSAWGPNHAALAKLSAAFGRGDIDAIMAQLTDDCAFEATGPAPDGARHQGAADVRGVWEEMFGGTREPSFSEEESFVAGDRGVLRWRFEWVDDDGSAGHVRGTDVLRFRDGRICEKFSYVKG
jgi:uncharacterized protein (TIGR03086 family)